MFDDYVFGGIIGADSGGLLVFEFVLAEAVDDACLADGDVAEHTDFERNLVFIICLSCITRVHAC